MSDFSFIQITDHHLLEAEEALRDGFPVKVSAPGAAPTPGVPSRAEARG